MGVAMLFLLEEELGATTTTSRSASTAVYLVLGVLLIALAVRLQRKRPQPDADPKAPSGSSKIDRYLDNRRLAFVLDIILYVVPSPIYIGAVKSIADAETLNLHRAAGPRRNGRGDAVADRGPNAAAADQSQGHAERALREDQ